MCVLMMKCQKRAQIQTQIFIYILSMIIVGLVLLYGYNAIKGLRERQEQVSLIEFESQLKNTIRTMSSEYSSLKKEILQLPPSYKMICFVNNTFLGTDDANCRLDADPESQAIVQNAIEDGVANIFLIPDGADNYKIGNIQLDDNPDGCLCIEKTGSEAIFRIEGLGDGVKISEWQD